MAIEALTALHPIAEFDCGEPSLNTYFKERALQHSDRDISRTYVLIEEGRVLGYHSIATGSVSPDSVHKNLPSQYPVPVVLLARLAIRQDIQGGGLGSELLLDALFKAQSISNIAGVYAVVLDALNNKAKTFYLKRGFVELKGDHPLKLYLTMKKIRQLPRPVQVG